MALNGRGHRELHVRVCKARLRHPSTRNSSACAASLARALQLRVHGKWTALLAWWMVTTTVRLLLATFWMARITMAAARASSPLVGSLQQVTGRRRLGM